MRFGEVPSRQNKETGAWEHPRPAVICGAQDLSGSIVAIQRIYFWNNDPALGRSDRKLSLGTARGAACRLGGATETLILPEAPEDGFSIFQEGPGFPVWVPFGTSMMPLVEFPPEVRRVIIARQNNTAGRRAWNRTVLSLLERGIEAGEAAPDPRYDDWNDQLKATLAQAKDVAR